MLPPHVASRAQLGHGLLHWLFFLGLTLCGSQWDQLELFHHKPVPEESQRARTLPTTPLPTAPQTHTHTFS